MQQGKEILENSAWLNRPTPISSTPEVQEPSAGQKPSVQREPSTTLSQKDLVNLFSTMTGLFGQKWTNAYGLADRNGEWLKTLNGLHPAQLEIGLNRVRLAGGEWPPTAPEFRKLCQPLPEELGLPTLAKAWREANEHQFDPTIHSNQLQREDHEGSGD